MNYVIALFLGVCFGFSLNKAGLTSATTKLSMCFALQT